MNFDNRSMALNDESALMILDTTIGGEMTRTFLADLESSAEITAETFRRRSWFQKVGEWGASLVRRVL
jgi:phosphatidylserine/phosphatidylglycerophosphate/cardiolipin synthase-like enzyme